MKFENLMVEIFVWWRGILSDFLGIIEIHDFEKANGDNELFKF